jgi:hypothetical protein
MDAREDEEEDGNVSSAHEDVSSKYERQKMGTVKMLKLRHMIGMVNRMRLVMINKG